MNQHSIFTSLIVLIVLVFFIVRQLQPRKPTRFRFYFMPIIALIAAYENFPKTNVPSSQLLECLVSVLIGIGFGILQARFTKVFQSEGNWYMQGDWKYVTSWLFLIVVRFVIVMVFNYYVPSKNMVVEWIIWIEIAVVWGVRTLVLMLQYPQLHKALERRRK